MKHRGIAFKPHGTFQVSSGLEGVSPNVGPCDPRTRYVSDPSFDGTHPWRGSSQVAPALSLLRMRLRFSPPDLGRPFGFRRTGCLFYSFDPGAKASRSKRLCFDFDVHSMPTEMESFARTRSASLGERLPSIGRHHRLGGSAFLLRPFVSVPFRTVLRSVGR